MKESVQCKMCSYVWVWLRLSIHTPTHWGWPYWLQMQPCGQRVPGIQLRKGTFNLQCFGNVNFLYLESWALTNTHLPWGPLSIDEAVQVAQGVTGGNCNSVSFWCLPQWHSSAGKVAVLKNRRLLEDKVVGNLGWGKLKSFICYVMIWWNTEMRT